MNFVEVKIKKAVRFKMLPTEDQTPKLYQFAGTRRWSFNFGLGKKNEIYKETGHSISKSDLEKLIVEMKKYPEYAWLKEVHSQIPQQGLADLEKAFDGFFEKRSGHPKFKKKNVSINSFRIPQNVVVENGKVYIPKLGWVEIIQTRPIEGTIKSGTFKADHLGNWFVTLNLEVIALKPVEIEISDVRGVDRGVRVLLATDEGEKIEPPKFHKKAERKIKRYGRKLSRKEKKSKNRAKAKRRLAKTHLRVKNQRQDFTHKTTTQLIRKGKISGQGYSFESLNTAGLAKSKLSKSILDAMWGEIERQMKYKGDWYDVPIIFVDRFFPSSKLCSACGFKHVDLQRDDYEWICPSCGTKHDRDINAGKNLRAEGIHILLACGRYESINDCGVRVRLALQAVNEKPDSFNREESNKESPATALCA